VADTFGPASHIVSRTLRSAKHWVIEPAFIVSIGLTLIYGVMKILRSCAPLSSEIDFHHLNWDVAMPT
jgi:hypothetical protein